MRRDVYVATKLWNQIASLCEIASGVLLYSPEILLGRMFDSHGYAHEHCLSWKNVSEEGSPNTMTKALFTHGFNICLG